MMDEETNVGCTPNADGVGSWGISADNLWRGSEPRILRPYDVSRWFV